MKLCLSIPQPKTSGLSCQKFVSGQPEWRVLIQTFCILALSRALRLSFSSLADMHTDRAFYWCSLFFTCILPHLSQKHESRPHVALQPITIGGVVEQCSPLCRQQNTTAKKILENVRTFYRLVRNRAHKYDVTLSRLRDSHGTAWPRSKVWMRVCQQHERVEVLLRPVPSSGPVVYHPFQREGKHVVKCTHLFMSE